MFAPWNPLRRRGDAGVPGWQRVPPAGQHRTRAADRSIRRRQAGRAHAGVLHRARGDAHDDRRSHRRAGATTSWRRSSRKATRTTSRSARPSTSRGGRQLLARDAPEMDPRRSGLYRRYELMVAYLLERRGMTVDELLARRIEPAAVLAAVRASRTPLPDPLPASRGEGIRCELECFVGSARWSSVGGRVRGAGEGGAAAGAQRGAVRGVAAADAVARSTWTRCRSGGGREYEETYLGSVTIKERVALVGKGARRQHDRDDDRDAGGRQDGVRDRVRAGAGRRRSGRQQRLSGRRRRADAGAARAAGQQPYPRVDPQQAGRRRHDHGARAGRSARSTTATAPRTANRSTSGSTTASDRSASSSWRRSRSSTRRSAPASSSSW